MGWGVGFDVLVRWVMGARELGEWVGGSLCTVLTRCVVSMMEVRIGRSMVRDS